jgi:hypothetical protein
MTRLRCREELSLHGEVGRLTVPADVGAGGARNTGQPLGAVAVESAVPLVVINADWARLRLVVASSLQRLGGWRLGARLGGETSDKTPPLPMLLRPGSEMLRLKESLSDSLDLRDSLSITLRLALSVCVCIA